MTATPTRAAARAALESDLAEGLWQDQPTLPPRWFYDEKGSRLFDEITRLPEYYPTRCEREILQRRSPEIADLTAARDVVEIGAGMSTKTRVLLDAVTARATGVRFRPIDVSEEVLLESAAALREEYPSMTVDPAVADFHDDLDGGPAHGPRLVAFLGGTIGNFAEDERRQFVARVRAGLDPGHHFLLGADLVKDPDRLVAAYDDAAGVTAEFNLNVLDVIVRTTDVEGLRREDFEHVARWNADDGRIEMHLRARRDVRVWFAGLQREWSLAAGDTLLTEISRKFDEGELGEEVARAGFVRAANWTDENGDYSLGLYRATDAG